LTNHTSDTTVHITAAERTAWNEKVTHAELTASHDDAVEKAAKDATVKANQALADSKVYSDGLNSAMDTRVKNVEGALTWKNLAE